MEYRKNFVQTRSLKRTFAPVADGMVVDGAWPERGLANGNEINRLRMSVKSAILRLILSPAPISWTLF
jgi:hypothetical protein